MREYEHDTNQSAEYAYDYLGNRILEKDNRDTLHYTYNELNQLVQKKAFNGVSTYEYDKRGNRVLETSEHTQENRRTLEWDAANRLAGGTRGTDWSLYKSEYTYNGLGMRVNSTIEGPEHTVYDRDYLIDYTSPERNDLAEYNVGHYQWQGTKPVHELKYLYTADGQRLEVDALHYSQWGGSDTQYTLNIHEDIMGSAVAYTYQGGWNDGQWANKHEFDVWGYNSKSPTYNYDPMYRATEPYFTGHQFDGSLNIYYADNRFYDAETGTWLSPDPIKDGLNWYTYCENNPVTNVDPTGLWAQMAAVSMQEKYKGSQVITQEQFEKVQSLYAKLFPAQANYAFQQNGWTTGFADTDIQELNQLLIQYGVTNPKSIRHLLTQVAAETGFGIFVSEVISEDRANKKYANSNGNYLPNDGYKYRGSGYVQLTGRNNYQAFSDYLDSQGRSDPKVMEEGANYVAEHYAWEASLYFWTKISGINDAIVDENISLETVSNIMFTGRRVAQSKSENYYLWKVPIFNALEGVFYEE